MAVDYMNDSYNRCIAELRERYRGRGICESVKSEAVLQAKSEASTRAIAPGAYVLFDSKSKIADVYRSGEYNGSKYMTSDDFVRYFKTRRAFYMPKLENEKKTQEAKGVVRKSGRSSHSSESGDKEGHLQTAISALKSFREKWFPIERKEGREQIGHFRIPVAALSGVAVFAVSLGLIVSGSVMTGSASGHVGRLNSEIATLEATQNELQSKLDLKYNTDEIEAEALNLGMVRRQEVDNKYVTTDGEEQIIVYEDGEDDKMGLVSLLASFGIKLD